MRVCVRRSNLFEVVQNVLRQFIQMACDEWAPHSSPGEGVPVAGAEPETGPTTGPLPEPLLMDIIMHEKQPQRCRTRGQQRVGNI